MNETITLDKIVTFEKTYSFSRATEGEGVVRHIHYGDIHTKLPSVVEDAKILPTITEKKDFHYLKAGDILVADASEDYKDLGKAICYIDSNSNVIAGLHTHCLRSNQDIVDPEYLINLFQTNRYRKYIWRMGTGVSVLGLSKNNLGKYEVTLPDLDKQKKVASFYKKLNKKIQLQQQKIDLLQEQKKGYMQEIFDQNQIDWNLVKLQNVFEERSEKGYINYDLLAVTLRYGVTDRTDIKKDTSSEDKSNYKRVLPGDIAYNSMRMWQGASGYSSYTGIVSPAYTVLKPKENVDSLFFAYLFKTDFMIYEFKKYSQGLTSDTWNLKYPLLKDIKVKIPSYEEQKRISALLVKIDEFITLQEKKLNLLQEQKKGFMQQIFV
ncbi:restriction endonuclease subunit S [Viridibacillus arvi]|uniref:restriction endonuclease subunit S n=1 Tax=Viridibacillus arvi TaxID=263475 RepID=UPI003D0370A1